MTQEENLGEGIFNFRRRCIDDKLQVRMGLNGIAEGC